MNRASSYAASLKETHRGPGTDSKIQRRIIKRHKTNDSIIDGNNNLKATIPLTSET